MPDVQDLRGPAGTLEHALNSPLRSEAVLIAYQVPQKTRPDRVEHEHRADAAKTAQQVDRSQPHEVVFESGEHIVTGGAVIARGNSVIRASGEAVVRAEGESVVIAQNSVKVDAHDRAKVITRADSGVEVRAHDKSYVEAHGWAKVSVHDEATVDAFDTAKVARMKEPGKTSDATVRLRDNAKVEDVTLYMDGEHWIKTGKGEARGKSIVHAEGDADVAAFDEATVYARDRASVSGIDRTKLFAEGNSVAYAFGNATLEARGHVEVHGHENPTIVARGNCDVAANDGTKLTVYDDVKVSARESLVEGGGFVEAYGNAEVEVYRWTKNFGKMPVVLHDKAVMKDADPNGKPVVRRADEAK